MELTRRNFFKIVAGIGGALALQGIDVLPDAIAKSLPREWPRYSRRTISVELINNGHTFYFPDIEQMGLQEREKSWVSVYVNDKPIMEMPCLIISREGCFNIGLPLILKRPEVGLDEQYLVAFVSTEV